jgi:hypothetical protein
VNIINLLDPLEKRHGQEGDAHPRENEEGENGHHAQACAGPDDVSATQPIQEAPGQWARKQGARPQHAGHETDLAGGAACLL